MHLTIEHSTRYVYDTPVDYSIQQLRLTPRDGFGQRVKRWNLRVNGQMQQHADAYGNSIHTLVVDRPHHEVNITAYGEVETGLDLPPQEERLPLEVYLRATPLTSVDALLARFASRFADGRRPMGKLQLQGLMHAVRERIAYRRYVTDPQTSAAQAFSLGEGVCQDHAHVFIACCRHLGVPARYVSGYLFTEDGHLVESHAWADAWAEGGWNSYDVSNGQMAKVMHVRLATGLDYRDACPISGVRRGGGSEQMAVQVQISQQ
jgi:transglutaminase-like putative cysteine protease